MNPELSEKKEETEPPKTHPDPPLEEYSPSPPPEKPKEEPFPAPKEDPRRKLKLF